MTTDAEEIFGYTPDQVFNLVTSALDWLDAHPKQWTRGAYARSRSTSRVDPGSEDAHCFCSLGRIAKEADIYPWELETFLAPIGVHLKQVVILNDAAHMNKMTLDTVREYFTRQYKKARLRQ